MGNSRRHGGRASGRRRQGRGRGEPELFLDVRRALATHEPVEFLALASQMVELGTRRGEGLPMPSDDDVPELATLVPMFIEARVPETTALLQAFAAFTPDQLLARRMRDEVARRPVLVLPWLHALDAAEVVEAWSITDVFGDGDNLLLGARLAGDEVFTAGLLVDAEAGFSITDGFLAPGPAGEIAADAVRKSGDDDLTLTRLDLADARARIEGAIRSGARIVPPFETETWPGCRPAVEWLLRAMPAGGRGYAAREVSNEERDEIAAAFRNSQWGFDADDEVASGLVGSLLWFGCGYGTCDPYRWSPSRIALLLCDWAPRKLWLPEGELARLPEVLRSFVRFAHTTSGIPEHLTALSLAAIDELGGSFVRGGAVRADDRSYDEILADFAEWRTDELAVEVGGHDVLAHLDAEPLPDEPFDWSVVPDDLRERTAIVLERIDAACDTFFDVECRTSARRVLARAIAGDPAVFRRRARDETTAYIVVWLVGRGNERFDATTQVKDMQGWFGISGSSTSPRARAIADAAGIPRSDYGYPLGDVALIDSRHRAEIIAIRDKLERDNHLA